MCLGLPGRIVSVADGGATGQVDIAGVLREIDLALLSGTPAPGDYVLVHSGVALERMSAEDGEAEASLFALPGALGKERAEQE
jgi:hydrogenase expression/formation protein HypC